MASKAQLDSMIPKILKAIKAPHSDINDQAMRAWADSEGIPDNKFNPWATTVKEGSAPSTNSDGVKKYKDEAQGVEAMKDTLNGHNSKDIKAALVAGDSLDDIYAAINASPWCANCQNGRYPVDLWKLLGHKPHRRSPGTEPVSAEIAQGESWGPHVRATAKGLLANQPTTQGATDAIRRLTVG